MPLNNYSKMIVKSLLEITMGLKDLSLLNIDIMFKTMLASFFLSLGGMSILMQVISQLADTNISIKPYLIGRIYQAIISFVLAYFLFLLFY